MINLKLSFPAASAPKNLSAGLKPVTYTFFSTSPRPRGDNDDELMTVMPNSRIISKYPYDLKAGPLFGMTSFNFERLQKWHITCTV